MSALICGMIHAADCNVAAQKPCIVHEAEPRYGGCAETTSCCSHDGSVLVHNAYGSHDHVNLLYMGSTHLLNYIEHIDITDAEVVFVHTPVLQHWR